MDWVYIEKSSKQLNDWFKDKVKKDICGFSDFEDFKEWYTENVRDNKCFYCGLTERESQMIVHSGFLTSKRFPVNGKFSQGVNRGYWLEIDKKNPHDIYSKENCVPSCYFCNNDKSDVFTDEQYKEFVTDRPGFIKKLFRPLNKVPPPTIDSSIS